MQAQFELWFPDISNGTLVTLGKLPDAAIIALSLKAGRPVVPHPAAHAISVLRGQTLVIHADDYLTRGSTVDKIFYSATKLVIRPGGFYLADGTKWLNGAYSVPDPAHGGYENMAPGYFPN